MDAPGTRAPPLPYDMGNAGDLLKHGVLAEFTAWWAGSGRGALHFDDPFGGRPWGPRSQPVERRLAAVAGTAVAASQDCPDRYLGSGHLVAHAARVHGGAARVRASDREPAARRALAESGLEPLEAAGFDPGDGYSALDADVGCDLLLLDPFADFIDTAADRVLPALAVAARGRAVALFVPDPGPGSESGRRYATLRERWLPGAWVLRCPRLKAPTLRGEGGFDAELLLAAPWLHEAETLAERLAEFAGRLGAALGVAVSLRIGA